MRTAIKFLVEDGRFDYIESGSMLGVTYKDIKSFPVGFEDIYQMFPISAGKRCKQFNNKKIRKVLF